MANKSLLTKQLEFENHFFEAMALSNIISLFFEAYINEHPEITKKMKTQITIDQKKEIAALKLEKESGLISKEFYYKKVIEIAEETYKNKKAL